MAVTPGEGADGSANGVVDAADYAVWRDNLGAMSPGSGGGGGAVKLPRSMDDEEGQSTMVVMAASVVVPLVPSYPYASAPWLVAGSTVVEEIEIVDGVTVDGNLLARLYSDGRDDLEIVAKDEDLKAAVGQESDEFDLAAVWEDDAWLQRLRVS